METLRIKNHCEKSSFVYDAVNTNRDFRHPIMCADSQRFSLVIPTHNRAGLIAATLDAALAQRLPFAEIIVVDDGSTDRTAEVLAAYAGRVHTIRLANGGVQRARNVGVAAASGDYVVLCDSDDLLEPEYLATMADWLASHPETDAVYTNFITFNERGTGPDKFAQAPDGFFDGARRTGAFVHDIPDLYGRTLAYQPLFPSGSVIRKAFYERIGGYDPRFNGIGGEDYEFTLRLIGQGRLDLCTTPLVRIRKHGGNDSRDNLGTVSGCVHILEYALVNHPWAQPYMQAVRRSIDQRRLEVFDMAFARGAFDTACQMLQRLHDQPHGAKFRLKGFIANLPSLFRQPLWRLSQRLG